MSDININDTINVKKGSTIKMSKKKDKKEKKNINKKSLGKRISMYLCAVISFLIIIIGIITSVITLINGKNTVNLTSSQNMKLIDSCITRYFDGITMQVRNLSESNDLKNINETKDIKKVKEILDNVANSIPDSNNVYYYSKKAGIITHKGSKFEDTITCQEWYTKALDNQDDVVIGEPYFTDKTTDMVLCVAKVVKKDNDVQGIAVIEVELKSLKEYLSSLQLLKTGGVIICDDKGSILVNHDKYNLKNMKSLPSWENIKGVKSGSFEENINGSDRYISTYKNDLTGWRVIGIIDGSEVTENSIIIIVSLLIEVIVAIIICIFISLILSRYVTKNIKQFNESFKNISDGDFTKEIYNESKDEFGNMRDIYNKMLRNISSIIKGTANVSDKLTQNSSEMKSMTGDTTRSINEVALAITQVAEGTVKQAESINLAVSEVNELSERLEEIKKMSDEISSKTKETEKCGNTGIVLMKNLSEKTDKTLDNAKNIRDRFINMIDRMGRINEMSNAISDITEQTNLLSLNASIEAARAGDAGKGFSVVAEEIRKLAEKSRKAADEIKQIVKEIEVVSTETDKTLKENNVILKNQNDVVNKTEMMFKEIISAIITMVIQAEKIDYKVNQIEENRNNVSSKINEIQIVSESTASSAEEVTASIEELIATMTEMNLFAEGLNDISKQLNDEIGGFKIK